MVPPPPKRGSKAEQHLKERMNRALTETLKSSEKLPITEGSSSSDSTTDSAKRLLENSSSSSSSSSSASSDSDSQLQTLDPGKQLDLLAERAVSDPSRREEFKQIALAARKELELIEREKGMTLMPRSAADPEPSKDVSPVDPDAPIYTSKKGYRSYRTDRWDPWAKHRKMVNYKRKFFLAMILGGSVAFHFNFTSTIDVINNPCDIQRKSTLYCLRVIWGRGRSRLFGTISEIQLPVPWRVPIFSAFSKVFGCKLDEIRYPLDAYQSLQEFFSRSLKDGVIQIDQKSTVVSPVDGQLVAFGEVTQRRIPQVKGADYDVCAFLGSDVLKKLEKKGVNENALYYAVCYLAPGDYHRFHAPVNGWQVQEGKHFAGEVLPVAHWLVHYFPDLFSVNERVVLSGDWKYGDFHYVSVAAYNVGNIWLDFSPQLKTNQMRSLPHYSTNDNTTRQFGPNKVNEFTKGDLVGGFSLGSTVVLVFEGPRGKMKWKKNEGEYIRVGDGLLDVEE